MNENLNLVAILNDCPNGTKLYSSVFGDVELDHIDTSANYPIVLILNGGHGYLTSDGKLFNQFDGECILFPSREERDWSKFKPKKNRFNPKTLKPFDKVLFRDYSINRAWTCGIFSHANFEFPNPFRVGCCLYKFCIPYNEDTKHLVGTTDEAPDYYRYWED